MQPLITPRVLAMIAGSGALGIVLTMLLTPLAIRLAVKARAVAIPRGRDMHEEPIPRWGGLAIYFGFLIPVGAAVAVISGISVDTLRQGAGIVVGATLISIVGAFDDRDDLSPVPRLAAQVLASIAAYAAGVRIDLFALPFTHHLINTHFFSGPITVFWMLLIMNAINWLDGLDGLAAGVCTIIAVFLAIMALNTRQVCLALFCATLAGSTIGFLRYNYSPAKIYMGGGAEFLGFVLAAVSVVGAFKQVTMFAVVVPVLAMAVPILDSVHVVVRRWLSGEPVYQADNRHFHHLLVGMGLTKQQAVLVLYLITLTLCLSAWALFSRSPEGMDVANAASVSRNHRPRKAPPGRPQPDHIAKPPAVGTSLHGQ